MIKYIILLLFSLPAFAQETIMIDPQQFREYIIRPTLQYLGLYSKAAENLLLGTALVESRLTYLKQHGTGPAVGVYQMEPATHDDIWDNYLCYHTDLEAKVAEFAIVAPPMFGDLHMEMQGNLYYATAMARIKYLRDKEPLPSADNIEELARYWKRVYNTPLGKGRTKDFVKYYVPDASI